MLVRRRNCFSWSSNALSEDHRALHLHHFIIVIIIVIIIVMIMTSGIISTYARVWSWWLAHKFISYAVSGSAETADVLKWAWSLSLPAAPSASVKEMRKRALRRMFSTSSSMSQTRGGGGALPI